MAKKPPYSRNLKGLSPVSRWEMNWLRTRKSRKPSYLFDIHKMLPDNLSVLFHYLSNRCLSVCRMDSKWILF
ncbi:hypothetical protein BK729_09050 [Bacillus thuringiensis serovar wratislaviensis]|nr:hypothetical protein BK729_09050 [Bacillus thuringiensis serovar wratislaviensis]